MNAFRSGLNNAILVAGNIMKQCTRGNADWMTLRNIGQHRAVRSSFLWFILVPLLAKLLAQVDSENTISVLGSTFTISLDLPFSWKVFYFSSVAVAAATAVYVAYCPSIIRTRKDFAEFARRDGKSQIILRKLMVEYVMLGDGRRSDRDRHLSTFTTLFCSQIDKNNHQVTPDTLIANYIIEPSKIAGAFFYVRTLVSYYHPRARHVCVWLYTMGFALLFWVFVDTFLFVVHFTTT